MEARTSTPEFSPPTLSVPSPGSTSTSLLSSDLISTSSTSSLQYDILSLKQFFLSDDESDYPYFYYILTNLLQKISLSDMSEEWKSLLPILTTDEWASAIAYFTCPKLKKLVDSGRQPTFEDLSKTLSWEDSGDWGVYAHLIYPITDPEKHHNHLYIGSTSKIGGLKRRRYEHKRQFLKKPGDSDVTSSLHYDLFRSDTTRNGIWKVLFRIPQKLVISDQIGHALRTLALLTEAVYSGLLDAYDARSAKLDVLRNMCPYEDVDWWGVCSHTSLVEGIRAFRFEKYLKTSPPTESLNNDAIQGTTTQQPTHVRRAWVDYKGVQVERQRIRGRDYRAANLEQYRQKGKASYIANAEDRRAYRRQRYADNGDAIRASQKTDRLARPEYWRALKKKHWLKHRVAYIAKMKKRRELKKDVYNANAKAKRLEQKEAGTYKPVVPTRAQKDLYNANAKAKRAEKRKAGTLKKKELTRAQKDVINAKDRAKRAITPKVLTRAQKDANNALRRAKRAAAKVLTDEEKASK